VKLSYQHTKTYDAVVGVAGWQVRWPGQWRREPLLQMLIALFSG
jgi:hypothetical protein